MRTSENVGTPPDKAARLPGLSVRGVSKRYGAIQVLHSVSLDVRPGECVALLGENGAGKSTLSGIISGTVEASEGEMSWDGEPYRPRSPADALSRGIGLIHQEIRLLPELSIAENIFLGRPPMKAGRIDRATMNRRAAEQLKRLALPASPTMRVAGLKIAAQQQVELAKALTLDAKLLIFDEPTSALGAEETDRLFEQIRRLKDEGLSAIYISHRLEEIARIADRIVVMRDGRKVADFESAAVPTTTLVEAMVGRNVERLFPRLPEPGRGEVLRVRGLTSAEGTFRDIDLELGRGEILGLAGFVGAGRTELVRAIAGADPVAGGEMALEGKPIRLAGPADAKAAGIVMVPEDRKGQGILLDQSIEENVGIGNFDLLRPRNWIKARELRKMAEVAIRSMTVKGAPQQIARRLSGGNQQKVLIGKWLARSPKVLILDEPTRGVDVGARAQIYEAIARMAGTGMSLIVVSSDLEEVIGLSHRVMVMARGRNMGVMPHGEATQVSIMHLATG